MTNLQTVYAVRISILWACCNLSMQIVKEYFDGRVFSGLLLHSPTRALQTITPVKPNMYYSV